jgi:hypothetical protein
MYDEAMKKLALILLAVSGASALATVAQSARAADTGTCYAISDADARAYCIARARHDTSACYTVQRADLRSQCLAEVRK